MFTNFIEFISNNLPLLQEKFIEQCYLISFSIFAAMIIAIPTGIILTRLPRLKNSVLALASMLWTIPGLAFLGFLVPFFGIGTKPALITLTFYSILPILKNTVAGIENVPKANTDAARALGFSSWEQMRYVRLPLAWPIIISGIRTALAVSIGVATLAAFIGAGGLGDLINQGLALNNSQLILLGAIPAALMALILDSLVARIEKHYFHRMYDSRKRKHAKLWTTSLVLIAVFACSWLFYWNEQHQHATTNTIRIATKNFSEQLILGELMTQLIEHKTHLKVIKKFNLGTTAVCQAALVKGDIDMYPEYTGTAYLTVLNLTQPLPAAQLYKTVSEEYLKRYHLIWLPPFGFNNSETLAVTQNFARQYNLRNISDLLPFSGKLIIGAPAEFLKRPDGYTGLVNAYGLRFKEIRQMEPSLIYDAIREGSLNVILAFTTDGRISAYHLVLLNDDKHFYPDYDAAAIIRSDTLKIHPEINTALQPLFGLLDEKTMQSLNYQVDVLKQSPAQVARQFLLSKGLINK